MEQAKALIRTLQSEVWSYLFGILNCLWNIFWNLLATLYWLLSLTTDSLSVPDY